MTRDEKITWMAVWAAKNNCQLVLEGEVGIGRHCVGIVVDGNYPDYAWYDEDYKRADKNGDVWCPENAYHKHPCVAVLSRGEEAEAELYEWLQWFDKNNFKIETGSVPIKDGFEGRIQILMGQHRYARMVRHTKKGTARVRAKKKELA